MIIRFNFEIDGEVHQLQQHASKTSPCDKCTLRDKCKGLDTSQAKVIKQMCDITHAGFRKVKKEAK